MDKTKIQWLDSTINPALDCKRWTPDCRDSCYAGAIHSRCKGSKQNPDPSENEEKERDG
jgi:protein gp37